MITPNNRLNALSNAHRANDWLLPLRRRHLGDQSCAALEGDVVPQPDECDNEAIAYLDQEIDVHHAPEQPAKEAGELEPAELHHRGVAADGGEIAHVVTQRNAVIINYGTIEPFSEPRRPTLVREGERTMKERTAATGISGQALAPLGTASNRTRNRACTRAISDVLGAQKPL